MAKKRMTLEEKSTMLADEVLDLKIDFNDICMREMGIDITDEGYIYSMDTESIITIKEKYIKYSDYLYPVLKHNEIDLNLIENSRLMESIAVMYISSRISNRIISFSQCPIDGTNKGRFVMYYDKNGEVKEYTSDPFINESTRIFNMICKLNKTSHLYRFDKYDTYGTLLNDYNTLMEKIKNKKNKSQ